MLSDRLSDFASALRDAVTYYSDPMFGYDPKVLTRCEAIIEAADALRAELDRPPTVEELERGGRHPSGMTTRRIEGGRG